MTVAPLYVGYSVSVCEGQLGPVIHLTQSLKLGAPSRQSVGNKTSFIIFLLFLLVARTHFPTGHRGAQRAEASCRGPGTLHTPDVVSVGREGVAVIVRLPDDSRHVALKVHVGARRGRGVAAAARVARLRVSAPVRREAGVGGAAVVAGAACMLGVVVMRDAEVRSS